MDEDAKRTLAALVDGHDRMVVGQAALTVDYMSPNQGCGRWFTPKMAVILSIPVTNDDKS